MPSKDAHSVNIHVSSSYGRTTGSMELSSRSSIFRSGLFEYPCHTSNLSIILDSECANIWPNWIWDWSAWHISEMVCDVWPAYITSSVRDAETISWSTFTDRHAYITHVTDEYWWNFSMFQQRPFFFIWVIQCSLHASPPILHLWLCGILNNQIRNSLSRQRLARLITSGVPARSLSWYVNTYILIYRHVHIILCKFLKFCRVFQATNMITL